MNFSLKRFTLNTAGRLNGYLQKYFFFKQDTMLDAGYRIPGMGRVKNNFVFRIWLN